MYRREAENRRSLLLCGCEAVHPRLPLRRGSRTTDRLPVATERVDHRHHVEIVRTLDNVDPNDMCNLKIVEAKILLLIQEYAELRQREMLQCEETTASQASTRVTGEVDPTFESKLDDLFA